MERKIGEVFEYNGVRLKVVEEYYCDHCYFRDKHENEGCYRSEHTLVSGQCSEQRREDGKSVQFIEIKNEKMKEETKSLSIPEGWEFAGYENGEVKIRSLLVPRGMHGAVSALCKLLIYRNAWWEKLGWKPDFENGMLVKYVISNWGGKLDIGVSGMNDAILAFPTEEVRDKFAETFKGLIEEAKELL